jgi:hypothetical protein
VIHQIVFDRQKYNSNHSKNVFYSLCRNIKNTGITSRKPEHLAYSFILMLNNDELSSPANTIKNSKILT